MRIAIKFATVMAVVILWPALCLPATGDIVNQFATPGHCPTGLAYDGKYLWMADRKTDSLYRIDPQGGRLTGSVPAPGFQIEGLAAEGKFLWALDIEEKVILKFDPSSGITEKTIPVPSEQPQGLAWDGKYLWVADQGSDKLFQISTEDGTSIRELPSPSGNTTGLSWDGKYLWVADRIDNMIYMVYPANGNVIAAFPSPSQYPRGVAYDGASLWNVDYQTDSLYQIRIQDTVLYVRTNPKRQQLDYTEQFRNYGPGIVTVVDMYIAIPRNLPFQALLDSLIFSPAPLDFVTDQWGQRSAHYRFENLAPGKFVAASMTTKAELYNTRFFVFPEKAGELSDLPADIKQLYLKDDSKYWISDSLIKATSRKVVGDETNTYWIARKLFNYLIDNMNYELAGGWNIAPAVLKRGTGSCSEYSFVYIALCRASGLPARYAGSVVIRGDDASTDEVFHRWVEVYLPHYGWIPVDPSGGDQTTPARQASAIGYLDNRFLITTIGGGGSEHLEWGYNSNEFWKSKGVCKVYTEHIGEWSPLSATEPESAMNIDPGKSCKPK